MKAQLTQAEIDVINRSIPYTSKIQLFFCFVLLASILVPIWGSWAVAGKVALTAVIGIVIVGLIHAAIFKHLAKEYLQVKARRQVYEFNRPKSRFDKKLEELRNKNQEKNTGL